LRFVNIGQSDRGRVLIVIHTERDDITHIISSRKATSAENALRALIALIPKKRKLTRRTSTKS
jgi:hypothetical protein